MPTKSRKNEKYGNNSPGKGNALVKVAFYGDSLTVGIPGSSYIRHLDRCLPGHVLVNHGKINDTVSSLQRRIVREHLLDPVDLAFVWIGVNDVLTSRSWLFSHLRRYTAYTPSNFRQDYRLLLDTVTPCASWVFTVPPVLIGEDLDGPFNRTLADIATIIGSVSADFENVRYVNLRDGFTNVLRSRNTLQAVAQNAFQSIWDAIRLRTDAQIEQVAGRRGFYLTLDGVHLNQAGAALAANTFAKIIREGIPNL